MSHPQPNRDANKAMFITAVGCLLPFHAPGFNGDRTPALNAIGELIQACRPAAPEEYDLAGRSLGYAAAAMDSLRLSMQPNLTDSLILQYRRNAIALGRSADQCRKALEVIRSKRQKQTATATAQASAQASAAASASAPMPAPDAPPSPVAPPRPAAPPRQMPPAQPHPPAASASAPSQAPADPTPATTTQTQSRIQPNPGSPGQSGRPARSPITAQAASAAPAAADPSPGRPSAVPPSPYPNSAVIGDPELTTDIAVMMHNAKAMLADLQALGEDTAPATPQAAITRHAMLQAKTGHTGNGATP